MIDANARTYLFTRGLFGGGALGAAYATALVLADTPSVSIGLIAAPVGSMFGAPIGGTLGLLCGMMIDRWLYCLPPPISQATLLRLRRRSHLLAVFISGIGTLLALGLYFQGVDMLLTMIPAILGAALLPVAADGYFERVPCETSTGQPVNTITAKDI